MNTIPDLQQENIDLQKIVADKDDIISGQEKSLQEKEKRIRILEEYILSLRQKQFGSSSEKQEVIQTELVFTDAEDNAEAETPEQVDAFSDAPIVVAEHTRKKKRTTISADLPRIEIIHDPSADQKCCPHEIFKRIGVELDTTTLANCMIRCGALVQPLINLLHERLLEQRMLHADETRVQVLHEVGRAAEAQSFMWLLRSTQNNCAAVLYRYEPTRSGKAATELLRDYGGALMVDGYSGYNAVCEQQFITRLGCWAHARRKFIEAQKIQKGGKTGKADQAIALIQQLYAIEKLTKEKTAEEKYRIRQAQSLPLLEKIKVWLDKSITHTLPQSLLGKALYYLHEQWPKLVRYVES